MIRLLCGGRLFRLAAGRFIPVGRSPLRLLLSFFLFLRLLRLAGGKNFLADLGSRFRCFKIFHRRCGIHRLCISLRLTFGRKRCVVFLLHGASSFPAYFHKLVLYQRLAGLSSLLPFWGRYPMLPVYHGRAGISCCFCKRNVTVGRKVPGGGVLVVPGGVGWQRKPPAGRAVRRTARRRAAPPASAAPKRPAGVPCPADSPAKGKGQPAAEGGGLPKETFRLRKCCFIAHGWRSPR